ncbi:Transposase (plasmid) [Shigella dysenteriae 1617]|uniref:Transposase n=1 Tax=Shigella dysenteriae 1617 TaxID=754093 RepID=A0A0A7A4W7_SHIDY|nr:Transposase [Shigella dysenteriae 1617]
MEASPTGNVLALLTPFNIGMITSDDWSSYGREVPKDKHLPEKYSPNGLSAIT